jgi:hypothetical protein
MGNDIVARLLHQLADPAQVYSYQMALPRPSEAPVDCGSTSYEYPKIGARIGELAEKFL